MTWPTNYSDAELTEATAAQELTRACSGQHRDNGHGCCLRCGAIKDMQGFWEAPLRRPAHAVLGEAPPLPPELLWRGFVLPRCPGGDYELRVPGPWGELLLSAGVSINRIPIEPRRGAYARVTVVDDFCDDYALVSEVSGYVGELGSAEELLLALDAASVPAIAKLATLGGLARRLGGDR